MKTWILIKLRWRTQHLTITLTGDNVIEFAYHEKISTELDADFYFAHSYSSWSVD